MKRSFFQAAVTSILLYGCTTWTLTKRLEKKLDGNYTRMLRAILNKSWRQHPTIHQLYGHLPPITKTIPVRRTRHAGHCWRSRDELIRDVLLWTPHMAVQKQDDQHEHTFSSYVRIRDVVLKTCLGRWTIGRSGERGSGISVLPAGHDDDDDDDGYSLRVFQISFSLWSFIGVWVTSSLLRTFLSILVDLNNTGVWMVSTRPLISMSSCPWTNPFLTAPRAPIETGLTVTFMFNGLFNSLTRSRYSSFFSLSSNFNQ